MPNLNNPIPLDKMFSDDGQLIKCKIVDITGWNMAASSTKTIPHGLSDFSKIIGVSWWVWNDAQDAIYLNDFAGATGGTGASQIWVLFISNTDVALARLNGGYFASVDFDDAVALRGKCHIWYTE